MLGPSWGDGDPEAWNRVGEIEDHRLSEMRHRSCQLLAEVLAARTGRSLNPDAMVIGFARRFAPYKRATLLMRQRDRLLQVLENDERPVHFVFAGKAHPSDDPGKALVAEVVAFADSADARGRVSFIPDYDMDIAFAMVQGCDVWLNNPIRPREASGTSGEKAVLNGCLNCSILDGWWAEMYDGRNGWSIPASQLDDPDLRDEEESRWVLDAILTVRDEYYGIGFNERIRHAWRTLGPQVVSARMLRDYQQQVYGPALERLK